MTVRYLGASCVLLLLLVPQTGFSKTIVVTTGRYELDDLSTVVAHAERQAELVSTQVKTAAEESGWTVIVREAICKDEAHLETLAAEAEADTAVCVLVKQLGESYSIELLSATAAPMTQKLLGPFSEALRAVARMTRDLQAQRQPAETTPKGPPPLASEASDTRDKNEDGLKAPAPQDDRKVLHKSTVALLAVSAVLVPTWAALESVSFSKRNQYEDSTLRTKDDRESAKKWTLSSRIVGGIAIAAVVPTFSMVIVDMVRNAKRKRTATAAATPVILPGIGSLNAYWRF